MNFLHIPGQGLGVLLIRIFSKTEIRSFWVRTPKCTSVTDLAVGGFAIGFSTGSRGSPSFSRDLTRHVAHRCPEHRRDSEGDSSVSVREGAASECSAVHK